MGSSTVTLKAISGPLLGTLEELTFDEPDTVLAGRAAECRLRLPDSDPHASTYHALLVITPPSLIVRDLGSLNGTFVNGIKIGAREDGETPKAARKRLAEGVELGSGDRLALGLTTLEVTVAQAAPSTSDESPREPPAWLQPFIDQLMGRRPSSEPLVIPGYRLGRELGRGGFGLVREAMRDSDGAPCAVKLMLPDLALDEHKRASFLREGSLATQLEHPNLVKTFEMGEHQGVFFIAMELCTGGDLERHLRRRGGKLPLEEALELMLPIVDALGHAHRAEVDVELEGTRRTVRGVVHRDIKPSNILLTNEGGTLVPKLADYGFAKAFAVAGLTKHTHPQARAGTPAFMPREQVLAYRYVTPTSDVYSLGATLYYILTGQLPRPFSRGEHPAVTLLRARAIPIRTRERRIPPAIAAVIDRALSPRLGGKVRGRLPGALLHEDAKQPVRYEDACEMGEALRSAIHGARPRTRIVPGRRKERAPKKEALPRRNKAPEPLATGVMQTAAYHAGTNQIILVDRGDVLAHDHRTDLPTWRAVADHDIASVGVMGNLIVTVGKQGEATAWNANRGQEVWRTQLEGKVRACSFRQDAALIGLVDGASILGQDGSITQVPGLPSVVDVAHHAGSWVVCDDEHRLVEVALTQQAPLLEVPAGSIRLSASGDGSTLLVSNQADLFLFSSRSRVLSRVDPSDVPADRDLRVQQLSADGSRLLFTTGSNSATFCELDHQRRCLHSAVRLTYSARTITGACFTTEGGALVCLDGGDGNLFRVDRPSMVPRRTDPHPGRPNRVWIFAYGEPGREDYVTAPKGVES